MEAPVPLKSFSRGSLFAPQTIAPGCLREGTVPWLLYQLGETLVPKFLQSEWRGAGREGRAAWSAPTLMALLLLRWTEGGMKRLTSCHRAKTDLAWRAAMGLTVNGETPTEKTVREFEQWLLKRSPGCDLPRYVVLHQSLYDLASRSEESAKRIWMMDGTPMICFGALRGTVRLLGDGLRSLVQRWARLQRTPFATLAQELGVPWVTAKSTKGGLAIDWRNAETRHEAINQLVSDVLRVVEYLDVHLETLPAHEAEIRQRCRVLLKVIFDDFETDASGQLVITVRRIPDRIVSVTDFEARSGRKTKSQKFKGFKVNVLGDLMTGLIASVKVVSGNCGEGSVGLDLLKQAQAMDLKLTRVLADSAYGGTDDRLAARKLCIELVAPPRPLQTERGEGFQKHEFAIDFVEMRATCPGKIETTIHRTTRRKYGDCQQFEWPVESCAVCPLRQRCMPDWKPPRPGQPGRPRKGKRVTLHPSEEALREARELWTHPERQAEYKRRGEGERLVARLVQFGARQARSFGLALANLQVHAAAMVANLTRLAATLARRRQPAPLEPLPLPLGHASP